MALGIKEIIQPDFIILAMLPSIPKDIKNAVTEYMPISAHTW